MERIIKIIKLIVALVLVLLALGYCGGMDSEYQQQREVMATKQPVRRIYE